jgi:hypothetical protein
MPRRLTVPDGLPDPAALATLRAWYEGASSRESADRYLRDRIGDGQSARGIIGAIRRQLVQYARQRQRPDLAEVFVCSATERVGYARAAAAAIEQLRVTPAPSPQISDAVAQWLPARAARCRPLASTLWPT